MTPADDRRLAQEILEEQRFDGADLPRPFAGALEWLGDRLQPFADRLENLGGDVPGGPLVLWTALAAPVIVAAGAIVSATIRRRAVAIERARAAARGRPRRARRRLGARRPPALPCRRNPAVPDR